MEKDFIHEALKEAKRSLLLNEVPVGAVIVKDNKIIARCHNFEKHFKMLLLMQKF